MAMAPHPVTTLTPAKAVVTTKGKSPTARRDTGGAHEPVGRATTLAAPSPREAPLALSTNAATSGAQEEKPAPERIANTATPREIVLDGEKMLSHGDVANACRRGEEAKKADPRLTTVYKFLGKCYMRAGDPNRAKENYRRYLELAPGAADAMFIESIVK